MKYLDDWEDIVQKIKHTKACKTFCTLPYQQLKDRRFVVTGDSEDILCPSMIDNYYPNRPAELGDMNLCTFMFWYDMVSKQPSEALTYYLLLGHFLNILI